MIVHLIVRRHRSPKTHFGLSSFRRMTEAHATQIDEKVTANDPVRMARLFQCDFSRKLFVLARSLPSRVSHNVSMHSPVMKTPSKQENITKRELGQDPIAGVDIVSTNVCRRFVQVCGVFRKFPSTRQGYQSPNLDDSIPSHSRMTLSFCRRVQARETHACSVNVRFA